MNFNRLQQLLQFLEQSPNEPFILFAIAKEHEGMGNVQKALKYYLQLQQSNPNYVGLYYHLGKLYEQQNEFDQALVTYTKGIEVAKAANDRHAWGELSEAKMMLED